MSNLAVKPLDAERFAVTSENATYTVTTPQGGAAPVCGCDAYRYRPTARPCKHGHAVIQYLAEPQAKMLDGMTDAQLLKVLGSGPPGPSPKFQAWAEDRAAKRARGELPPLEPVIVPSPDGWTRVADLVAEPDNPHPWVVHGLIPSGGMALVAGKPKAGKSTLARALALRVCRGEPILGRETMGGPVLYLGLEDPKQAIKGHFQRMGVRLTDDLYYTGKAPAEYAQVWLAEQLTKKDPVLVVIDTMQFFLGIAEINEYGQVVNALRSILDLFRGKRPAVLIVHHAGKGERSGFDAILGSTGILGTVDTAILVKRRPDDQTRTIATMQRMHAPGGEDMPETVLTLDDHTEPTLSGTLMDYELDKMGETIKDYLAGQPSEWVERSTIVAAVEGRVQSKTRALDSLFRSGQLERQGEGKRGSPYLFRIRVFRSPDTPGTAEQKRETPEMPRPASTIAVPAILPLEPLAPVPGNGNGTGKCPKGHGSLVGDICPDCEPARFLAALDAEAAQLKTMFQE